MLFQNDTLQEPIINNVDGLLYTFKTVFESSVFITILERPFVDYRPKKATKTMLFQTTTPRWCVSLAGFSVSVSFMYA